MVNSLTKTRPLPPCHLCGGNLQPIPSYPVVGQVTSDCRPWQGLAQLAACQACGTVQKAITQAWHQEAEEIYAGYAVYAQAEGGEQLSFEIGSGANRSRSQTIVQWLKRHANLPEDGLLLDIGCGNGSFLKAFQQELPNWQMIGAELDDRNRKLVESIPGVLYLHTGPLAELAQNFDLAVMIHALEHIPEPIGFLSSLNNLLKPSGRILIEVPDLESSPFDILIADHCTHFNQNTLRWVVESAGHHVLAVDKNCVAKELTLLAEGWSPPAAPTPLSEQGQLGLQQAEGHIVWLKKLLDQAHAIEGDVGLFGTSISATWLAKALDGRVKFFVDEDVNRIGNRHLGVPILSIKQAPASLPILMPIRRDIALAVKNRLGFIHPTMIIPPEDLNS